MPPDDGAARPPFIDGDDERVWPKIEPLAAPTEVEKPYPIDALPLVVRDAVLEYQAYGQQPLSLAATSGLASVSLAAQALATVARDDHLVGPISLYFLVAAVSGERKTSADGTFKRPISDWMIGRRDEMQFEVRKARAALAAWEAEREGLLARIKSASGQKATGKEADMAALKEQLAELECRRPVEVIVPKLFYEDTNSATLACDLATGWPSASLWSDEGGLIIGSHGMSDEQAMAFIALLNRLWDGKPFDRSRSTVKSASLCGRVFTSSLMVQPAVMARLLSLAGGASRAMGLIARFCVAWPTSTIGTRMYRPPALGMPAVARLAARLCELLDMPLPVDPDHTSEMVLAPPALRLSYEARRVWEALHDDVEAELGRSCDYAEVADIGAKIAENAARLAANFHIVEHGPEGEIAAETMQNAGRVACWHLYEARRVLAALVKPQSIADAGALLEWILKQPPGLIEPRRIRQFGPSKLRDTKRRDTALKLLAETGHLVEIQEGGAKRYCLNPRVLAAANIPDQPVEIRQDGLSGRIRHPSLYRLAGWTYTEGNQLL